MIPAALRMDSWIPAPLPAPKPRARHASARHYVAARLGGTEVIASLQAKDAEVRKDLRSVRKNSRLLANNNPFFRRYIRTIGGQVVGPRGILLQSDAPEPMAKRIETAWAQWGRKGSCTICGRYSWLEVQRLFLRTMALDGEAFLRLVPDKDNPFGLSLQFLDADLLDPTYSRPAGHGLNAIVMGVELNAAGRPVAYWFSDPASASSLYDRGAKIRIPAAQILHGMDPERANQTRGMPWAASAMFLVDMLGHYWESEVAAARHEAERQAFLTSETLDLEGEAAEQEQPAAQEIAARMQGSIKYIALPPGVKADIPEVQHPTTAFAEFSRAMLKGIASGLGISYASLASDLTQVNYSSIRQGTLDDREYYRELQQLLVETLCERVFALWFDLAQISGALQIPVKLGFEKAVSHTFTPRGWAWVDPRSDAQAQDLALANRTISRTRILAEQGMDIRDLVEELAFEEKLLKEAGIEILPAAPKAPEPDPPKEDPDAA